MTATHRVLYDGFPYSVDSVSHISLSPPTTTTTTTSIVALKKERSKLLSLYGIDKPYVELVWPC